MGLGRTARAKRSANHRKSDTKPVAVSSASEFEDNFAMDMLENDNVSLVLPDDPYHSKRTYAIVHRVDFLGTKKKERVTPNGAVSLISADFEQPNGILEELLLSPNLQ